MEQASDAINPFWMFEQFGFTPVDALKVENESLRKIIAAQELRIDALTKLVDLQAVNTLIAENEELRRSLDQQTGPTIN